MYLQFNYHSINPNIHVSYNQISLTYSKKFLHQPTGYHLVTHHNLMSLTLISVNKGYSKKFLELG